MNLKIKYTYLLVPLVLLIIGCNNKNIEKPIISDVKVIKQFFNDYETYNANKAVDYVFQSNEWIKNSLSNETKDSLKIKLTGAIELLGQYRGYEILEVSDIGKSYKVISSLAKYDRQPIRYVFILYKPSDTMEWQVQNFVYDFNIEDELYNTTNMSFY